MPWNLAVLMGGPAPERPISLQSGAAMARALESRGHRVAQLDWTFASWLELDRLRPDCVVLALHGVPGEDGTAQAMLELLGLPYTGSGVAASAIAIDKALCKDFARALGLRTAPDARLTTVDAAAARALIAAEGLRYPLSVKGTTAGSTLGLTKVTAPDQLEAALTTALAICPMALLEEWIAGIEISVCLLGNENPRILPTPQILSDNAFFDFEAKYTPGMSRHRYPPDCPADVLWNAEQDALSLYRALGCAGCARVDLIVTAEGVPVFLELNTIPGMTEVSILPDAAAQIGLDFADVCEELVRLGLERARGRPSMRLASPVGRIPTS